MEKNKSKIYIALVILLVALIVMVLGFGIYFIVKLESEDKSKEASSSNSSVSTSQTSNVQDNSKAEKQNDQSTSTTKQETISVESKEDFINSCGSYTYKEIARNPNNYVGKRAKFTGEVVQVMEEDKTIAIRLNVTKGQYGIYEDTIMVGYRYKDENESKILEKDIVTVYGVLNGNTSYTSVLGAEITLPLLIASYIDINE